MSSPNTFAAPPRRNVQRSGTQKLAVAAVCTAIALALGGVGYWFANSGPPPAPPMRQMYVASKGEPMAGPIEKVVHRPPQPERQNHRRTGGPQYVGPTIIADPQLSAPITVRNQAEGHQGFLTAGPVPVAVHRPGEGGDEEGGGEDNPLSQQLRRSNLGPKSKAYVDHNSMCKLYPGSRIPLSTVTRIDTTIAGYVSAIIPDDVYSDEHLLLMPGGSKAFGQIKNTVQFGLDRVPILWTHIDTSDKPKIIVPINSPGADRQGAAGVTGDVNNHLGPMFWATAIYTLIQAAPNALISALQNNEHNNNNIQLNQFVQPSQSLGAKVLDKYLNIPSTLEAPPDVPLVIFVGNEMDFCDAIGVRLARGR